MRRKYPRAPQAYPCLECGGTGLIKDERPVSNPWADEVCERCEGTGVEP